MLKRVSILLLSLISVFQYASAKAPSGYYSSLKGKSTEALKTALYQIINPHTEVSSYNALPSYFQQTDLYPNSQRWWDMYSSIPIYLPWSGQKLNREHCLPKSWWGGNTSTPAYVDLFHLYPAEAAANQAKSNWPLGVVTGTPSFDNGFVLVGKGVNSGGADKVFEPNNEYKGDFARTYFYMVTCYQDLKWNQSYMFMLNQNLYPTLNAWSVRLLLKWHREDPVSQKELDRNEVVYSFQDNRNPFIDCPDLVEYIWGDKAGLPYQAGSTGGDPVADAELEAPVNGAVLEFGQVALGSSATAKLFFKGANIRQPLTLRIYRGDTGMFSTPVNTISTSLVNSAEGTWLTLTYKPTELGQHTARLLINGTGVDGNGSRGVELRGECLERPTLTAPVATAATDITATSYTANWTPAEGDVVDYYVVTRTRYNAGIPTVEEIVADETGIVIDEFDLSDSESYSVHSVRLGVESPESNVIFVSHAGITDAAVEHPLEVLAGAGAIALRSTVGVENVRVYDVAGREVAYLPEVLGLVEVQLPAGVYMVAGGYGTEPVKVVVR